METKDCVIINCISVNSENIIINLGVTFKDENESFDVDITKEKLIKTIRKIELSDKVKILIKTKKGTKVEIINNKYFRTDGDKNKNNDLLDCDKC